MKTTVFRGARIIPADSTEHIEDGSFCVQGGRITALGPSTEVAVERDAEVVDLSGLTVMPTIVNPHGHIGYLKDGVPDAAHYSRENVLDHLRRLTYYGVSVIQSLGTDRDDVEISVRDEQRTGRLRDPELALLMTAGRGLVAHTPGQPNGGPFFATDSVIEVRSASRARDEVRRLAAKRPDAIKFWVDDRGGAKAKLSPAECAAIVDEAHSHGIPAIAHIHDLDDAKNVLRAGADGTAHMVRGGGPDDELLELHTRTKAFVFSSISVQATFFDDDSWLDAPDITAINSAASLDATRRQIDALRPYVTTQDPDMPATFRAALATYLEGGVRVLLSADTGLLGQLFGIAEHREIQALVSAGMPPLHAIRSATAYPAEVLGLADRGTLTVGKRADFIVLRTNPLEDIRNTRDIDSVFIEGTRIDRESLRRTWADTRSPQKGAVQ
ncbi:amidohydrolase family protein [Microbacterium laevaniformans]|uniref:amidohydrolase family protein n=1 Tax=Microbacterium laevaniformans TaxID=36807 RepID=UPI0036316CD7